MYIAAVIHLSHVDQLLTATDGDLLRVRLVQERLIRGLDCVHGVPGPGDDSRQVVDAGETGHFKDTVGNAKAET